MERCASRLKWLRTDFRAIASRFLRVNILWQDGAFFIRDLHQFDEKLISPTHEKALTATSLSYESLPVMDWSRWSEPRSPNIGMWPMLTPGGMESPMIPEGDPVVKSVGLKEPKIRQPLKDGARFVMDCEESKIIFTLVDAKGNPLNWAWKLVGGEKQKALVESVTPLAINYSRDGIKYRLPLLRDSGQCRQMRNGDIQIAA